ncbi:uncharacterized protein LOC126883483 [Diabrotica virgifera virgifera]|uniref:Retrotransposon gag domain-containing protein n=1 Tax=Diabrotica virgifera virgifera TaxID=50390 RepID=A0ABM5K4A5_DIAVI|nr:uncharacterized protein LOC126883483 [Diabrotica virgifera virgifera]
MDKSIVAYLKKEEVEYELKIRGTKSRRQCSDKKSMLKKLIQKGSPIDLENNPLNFAEEKTEIERTIADITQIVEQFEGNVNDSTYRRAKALSTHVSLRIGRMPIDITIEDQVEFKDEISATCLLLESQLDEKIIPNDNNEVRSVDTTSASVSSFAPPIVQVTTPINLSDWNIKFSGDPKSVFTFLEKVQDIAESRKVDDDVLFRSAIELFSGSAVTWFRSVRDSLSSWSQLINLIKATFLPHDYEEELWQQIKNRKQKRSESFILYQAQILTLAKRLPFRPLEQTLVKYMRQNILPEYVPMIALQDTNTLGELALIIKKLENNVPSVSTRKDNPHISVVSEKNVTPKRKSPQNKPNIPPPQVNQSRVLTCWNCHEEGHRHSLCNKDRRVFCFRCGLENVIAPKCPICKKN